MWLYIPRTRPMNCVASASVPASEASTSACTSQNPDIELWALSSETVSPRPLSWPGWKTRPWHKHLSGAISSPSMAAHGATAFILSLPVIRASRSRCQGSARGQMIPGTSGPMLPESSERSTPSGSSSKTSQGICPLACRTSPETFRQWATGLQRASSRRRKLARRTSAIVSSFWATPTFKSSGNRAAIQLGPNTFKFQVDRNQTGSQIGLKNQVASWTLLRSILDAAGWQGQTFRCSLPRRVILLHGEKHCDHGLTLNPAFTDWMMGWPSGWTDPLQPVTEWSHWLRRSRGVLSDILCNQTPFEGG